jgi:long-subunit fatty acid transport protein
MTRFGTQGTLGAAALLMASTGLASAGGLDRTGLSISPLFEDGSYAELSFGLVSPSASGVFPANGSSSGDMLSSFSTLGLAYKQDITDAFSVALIFETAFGAAVDYTNTDATYPVTRPPALGPGEFNAELAGNAITAVGRYELGNGFSVHGGLRYVTMSAEINFTTVGQTLTYDDSSDLGYLVGFAYEIPDIALRASLTYNSETTHNNPVTGSLGFVAGLGPGTGTPPAVAVGATGTYTLPQSVNLDFQTGIAENTLVLASLRWAEWTETAINTQSVLGIIDYDNDVWTWSAGAARRLNEDFAILGRVTYERSYGGLAANLDPKDGTLGFSIAGIYDVGNARITAGLNFTHLGDATTERVNAVFTDNYAIGAGLRVGFSF